MNLSFSAEQNLLRESVARFCKSRVPMPVVRQLLSQHSSNKAGLSDDLWRDIAGNAWLGVVVPEDHGGLGLGAIELGIIAEELGRALCPGPYFSCAALAAPVLASPEVAAPLQARLLPALCSGEKRLTLALLEEDAQLGADHVRAVAEALPGGGFRLRGRKFFVPDLPAADAVLCAARASGDPDHAFSLFLVEIGQPGVSIEPNTLTDATSRSGQLVLDDVTVGPEALVGALGGGGALCEQTLLYANVALAAASVAGAEQVLAQAVAYVRDRKQFGVSVGSFQAIKHPLADVFAEIEGARSAYHYAAWAVDARSPDVRSAVAVARLLGTAAFRQATLTSHQAHGGIGFTWEYDLHLYLKRAKHNEYFLGVPADYEEIVAREALHI